MLCTGCASYTQISNTERIITYTNISGEEINYLEKFDNKTNQWFRAICKNLNSSNMNDCSNNTEFTNLSKIKIANLLSNEENNNSNNQKSNSNNNVGLGQSESNDSEDEDSGEGEEEEEEEEEEEGGEGGWEDGE